MDTTKQVQEAAEDIEETKTLEEGADGEVKKLSAAQKKKLKLKQKKEADKVAADNKAAGIVPEETSKPVVTDEQENVEGNDNAGGKKSKKNKNKKAAAVLEKFPLRVLGEWPADCHPGQTEYPPSVPMTL